MLERCADLMGPGVEYEPPYPAHTLG
jgi:hypothetical protein